MRVVKADRWHRVEAEPGARRCCSVCGSTELTATDETVLDSSSLRWYRVVRCGGCAYDLLEESALAAVASC
jgi:hypothetical protein